MFSMDFASGCCPDFICRATSETSLCTVDMRLVLIHANIEGTCTAHCRIAFVAHVEDGLGSPGGFFCSLLLIISTAFGVACLFRFFFSGEVNETCTSGTLIGSATGHSDVL